eukprot:scaffold41119_cov24-Attheya_sp.AAC.1
MCGARTWARPGHVRTIQINCVWAVIWFDRDSVAVGLSADGSSSGSVADSLEVTLARSERASLSTVKV